MNSDLKVLYPIFRSQVEALDCSSVLARLNVDQLPADMVHALFGRVHFALQGYDAHPDEVYMIPEVRRYLRQFHAACPHWLYFGSLHGEELQAFYLALLDSVECVRFGDAGLCRARFNRGELIHLLARDMTACDELCLKVGIRDAERLKRATAILRYFQLA